MTPIRSCILLGLMLGAGAAALAGNGVQVTVTSQSPRAQKSCTIEIALADIVAQDPSLAEQSLAVSERAAGQSLDVQVSGGILLFQSDFAPGETKKFVVRGLKPGAVMSSRVDALYALPRQDYAWENDRIAYRVYGPALAAEVGNGIDVWTKRVRSLIVKKWYDGDARSSDGKYYHTDRGEGADFFAVGKSLGAGGCGIWRDGRLYHPGVFSSFRTLCNGPVRTSFELTYREWDAAGEKVTAVQRVTLDAGRNLNRIDVVFTCPRLSDSLVVACGLVKRPGVVATSDVQGVRLALWGPTNDDPVNGFLGTGIVLHPANFVRMMEDSAHYLVLGRAASGMSFTYWSGAGWSRSGDFDTPSAWLRDLDDAAAGISKPLHVSLVPLP